MKRKAAKPRAYRIYSARVTIVPYSNNVPEGIAVVGTTILYLDEAERLAAWLTAYIAWHKAMQKGAS